MYRKAGNPIKICAAMFRVSVPTANRIIAKFKAYDERVESLTKVLREAIDSVRGEAIEAIGAKRESSHV
jgi:hypothetical protein